MPRQSTVYEVLIASPSDVSIERVILSEVVDDWNSANSRARGTSLQALRWEIDAMPGIGDRPQGILNEQLVKGADLLMGVFHAKLGTPTGKALSGTAEEIEEFRAQGKPVLLYFSKANIPLDHDPDQLRMLREYQKTLQSNTLYSSFANPEELRRQAARDLANQANRLPIPTSKSGLDASKRGVGGLQTYPQGHGKPIGLITSPTDGTEVLQKIVVSGRIDSLHLDLRVWLVIKTPVGDHYPQCRISLDRAEWHHEVRIGRLQWGSDNGAVYEILLIATAADADYKFDQYVRGDGNSRDGFGGFLPVDIEILDSKRVVRQDKPESSK
jgi:hypothetical protein